MADLKNLVADFMRSEHRRNPADPALSLNLFVNDIQSKGYDLSEWTETDWLSALNDFDIHGDKAIDALENIAGWGVVDNFVWASPSEEDLERAIESEE